LAINKNEPTAEFAKKFVTAAEQFLTKTQSIRALQLVDGGVNLQELIAAQDS
jgi:hypothetical protein